MQSFLWLHLIGESGMQIRIIYSNKGSQIRGNLKEMFDLSGVL